MSTQSFAVRDSTTMLRRYLLRMRRYPSMTIMVVALPVIFLLLFVYVFGATLGDGLAGIGGGRAAYANYVAPGIFLLTVVGAAEGTAISVAMDMTEGIIGRFRTMAIFRPSVLTGHVLGSLVQAMMSLIVVTGIALLVGFRPHATVTEWIAAAGLLALISFAIIWLCVAFGLVTKSVETASNLPMPLVLLPFLGSGFVPAGSMPAAIGWFAAHQPFTPMMETLRGLLLGTPIGNNGVLAVGWCVLISAASYLWARRLYRREPSA